MALGSQAANSAMGGEEATKCPAGSIFASMHKKQGLYKCWQKSPHLDDSPSGDTGSDSLLLS